MLRLRYLAFIALIILLAISACASNKKVVVDPEPVRNPLVLARIAAQEGAENYEDQLFEEAITSFQSAIELFNEAMPTASEADSIPLNIERLQLNIAKSHIDLAFENVGLTLYNDAIVHYENALAIYKNHVPVSVTQSELDENVLAIYNNMALTAKTGKMFEQTITYYDAILAIQPNNAEILNAKFFVLSDDLKDDDRAFKVLADYAEVSQDQAAYIMLADKYVEKKNNPAAEAAYIKALELSPDADMYIRLARFYRTTGEWAKANTYLERLAATNPEPSILANVYAQIGENYAQLKNNAKMVEFLEKSFNTERNTRIALTLASHFNTAKNWGKVITYATAVIQAEANNADARMLRGVAYYSQKNYASAKTDLERIVGDPRHGAQAQNLLKNMPK